jgi:predicted SAM-dependent methyltransferase
MSNNSKKKPSRKAIIKNIGKAAIKASETPELAPSVSIRKLDLACGQRPKEGFEGVDIFPGAQHVVDLQRYPWPFETSSIDEVHCSHYCEHIPMDYVDPHGNPVRSSEGKDALFMFFDELWRILKPNAWATIIVPNARSNRGFQDPTHRRFFVGETFLYLYPDWRKANGLDHYKVECNFAGNPMLNGQPPTQPDVFPSIPHEFGAWSAEVQAKRFTHEWNTILDWHARLRAVK